MFNLIYINQSVIIQTKTLRTPTNMFVVNLALSDAIMMFCMGPPVTFNAFVQRLASLLEIRDGEGIGMFVTLVPKVL